MKSKITAAVTAISLALGGFSAAPVNAGDDARDLAKFLLFSSMLMAIVAGNDNHDKSAGRAAPSKPRKKHHAYSTPVHSAPQHHRSRHKACLEDFWNGQRWVTFQDHLCRRHKSDRKGFRGVKRCLRQEFRHGRWISTFDGNCMQRKGFTIHRRR